MTTPRHPFAKPKAKPGEGEIVVSLLPPSKQVLTTLEYQYPLKLISPDPHRVTVSVHEQNAKTSGKTTEVPVTTVFLLTYGGGLLAGDTVNLTVTLEPHTRLALLTQGSTKIFKADSNAAQAPTLTPGLSAFTQRGPQAARQTLNVKLSPHAALCYLPDPNQPYAHSTYIQRQTFYVDPHGSSSLLFLDWVSEGRSARGEKWSLTSWRGRNEIREFDESSTGRLLIRDSLLLFGDDLADLHAKTDGKGIFGTLIIYGPMFRSLADFFMKEFKHLPRLGAKNWAQPKTPTIVEEDESAEDYFKLGMGSDGLKSPAPRTPGRSKQKEKGEQTDGLLWTAAQVRRFVLVKFGAADVDGARRWLGGMMKREGSVEREFGHQALLCMK